MTSSYGDAAVKAAGIKFNVTTWNRLSLLQTKFLSTYGIEHLKRDLHLGFEAELLSASLKKRE